jgi:hypothetical protein
MTVMDKISAQRASKTPGRSAANTLPPQQDDGTRALLIAGFWITAAGLLALFATRLLFGGIGIHGPHTNSGWLSFMFALMGIPFGLMLLVLGAAKWLRNRHLAHHGPKSVS